MLATKEDCQKKINQEINTEFQCLFDNAKNKIINHKCSWILTDTHYILHALDFQKVIPLKFRDKDLVIKKPIINVIKVLDSDTKNIINNPINKNIKQFKADLNKAKQVYKKYQMNFVSVK